MKKVKDEIKQLDQEIETLIEKRDKLETIVFKEQLDEMEDCIGKCYKQRDRHITTLSRVVGIDYYSDTAAQYLLTSLTQYSNNEIHFHGRHSMRIEGAEISYDEYAAMCMEMLDNVNQKMIHQKLGVEDRRAL